MTLHDASRAQIAAADPTASTWLHANAGSGKTKVLIDRVARLLLSGVAPQQILCLTYTKAAAAEMQNRLFSRLGAWAMMPDVALESALQALAPHGTETVYDRARARQLFARAIETPGGLRIQTIHSFCATLLRRFPLEAGVSPHFTELDDRTARVMRADIAEEIAIGPHAATVERLARAYVADDFGALLGQIASARNSMDPPLDAAGVRAMFDVDPDETPATIMASVLLGDESSIMAALLPALANGSKTDCQMGAALQQINLADPNMATLEQLEQVFLFKSGARQALAKIDDFPTKATRNALPDLMPRVNDLMRRVEGARQRRLNLAAAEKTAALHAFAQHYLPAYAARKSAFGVLDFDDLISRARALLHDSAVAQWVLYRLDGGIDHILVDEAQDTSPEQWQVFESLTDAFIEGQAAHDRPRTIFVVGDQKQSIYSFQGADVAAFDRMKAKFDARLSQVGAALQVREIVHSFRSSPAILSVVDATFDRPNTDSVGGAMNHVAYFDQMPGQVELWPIIEPVGKPQDADWSEPIDLITDEHHAAQMGSRVADWIADALFRGLQIAQRDGTRALWPGDVLVLVQRRAQIFDAVIRACKARGLPIAGSDRLKLGDELVVKDLLALLSFLATDVDDLSLAAVLRSPLCGLSEADLYRVAHGREGPLWSALQKQAERHDKVLAMLHDLRSVTDLLRPYDLIERVLTRHGGRLLLVARLGGEAEDAIDELLTQALAYESAEIPSLTGFLTWLDADEISVKRQMETDGGRIRVMTVHGAKGLEAPVVILPDTADRTPREQDQIYAVPNGPVLWKTNANDSPPLIEGERRARRLRNAQESDRLLYVAMTRAQSLLIVAAAGEVSEKETANSWYKQIRHGMQRVGAVMRADGGMVHRFGVLPEPAGRIGDLSPVVPLPPWVGQLARAPIVVHAPLSPSALGGAKALAGEDNLDAEIAKARGTRLHRLLEVLPGSDPDAWQSIAHAIDAEDVLAEAKLVLAAHPVLFGPDTLAEVPFVADVGGRRLAGSIDRLIVADDHVVAVDFKSNRVVPSSATEVPEGLLRQMGAYAAALAQIYPDHRIETAIVWTRTAEMLRLHPDIVRLAFDRALSLDVPTSTA
jgi:ATP-dependent helicase/nuclease subunit A